MGQSKWMITDAKVYLDIVRVLIRSQKVNILDISDISL